MTIHLYETNRNSNAYRLGYTHGIFVPWEHRFEYGDKLRKAFGYRDSHNYYYRSFPGAVPEQKPTWRTATPRRYYYDTVEWGKPTTKSNPLCAIFRSDRDRTLALLYLS